VASKSLVKWLKMLWENWGMHVWCVGCCLLSSVRLCLSPAAGEFAMSHSPPQWWGWVPPRELAQQDRGASPRRMMAPPHRCQSIKCPYPRAGAGVRVRSALERGGARSR
jgi:hypothetical protein